MNIANIIRLLVNSEVEKYLLESKALRIGELLKGKVVEVKGKGKALVDFGRFRAVADIKFKVKEGEVIKAKVVETKDKLGKIVLNIENDKPELKVKEKVTAAEIKTIKENKTNQKITHQIERVLGSDLKEKPEIKEIPVKIKNDLVKVKEFFKGQDPRMDLNKITVLLKKTIQNSGIFFEKKLKKVLTSHEKISNKLVDLKEIKNNNEVKTIIETDLKSNLLKLRHFFDRLELNRADVEVQKSINLLKNSIQELLNYIKFQQDGAVKKFQNNEPIQIFNYILPLIDSEEEGPQQMKVYYKKEGEAKGKKSGYRVSLLLNLKKLGDVRCDLFLQNKNLNITFFVKDEETKKYFDSNFNTLNDRVSKYFSRLTLTSIVSEEKIKEFETEDIEQSINNSLVDMRI